MNPVCPKVHPVEGPLAAEVHLNDPKGKTKKIQGEVGTFGSLMFSLIQFILAFGAFLLMVTTVNFSSISSFRYFAVVTGLHTFWSLLLIILNTYALLVKRFFEDYIIWIVVGDLITSTLTFTAAIAAGTIVSLSRYGLYNCATNECEKTLTASAMALVCFCATMPSCCIGLWVLA